MLPSSITTPTDRVRSSSMSGSLLLRSSVGTHTAGGNYPLGRGPLAQRAMKLLGIGATGQAWSSWAQPSLAVAFQTSSGPSAAAPWLAARSLPTPNGYARS
jgi:hypothetical protein